LQKTAELFELNLTFFCLAWKFDAFARDIINARKIFEEKYCVELEKFVAHPEFDVKRVYFVKAKENVPNLNKQ